MEKKLSIAFIFTSLIGVISNSVFGELSAAFQNLIILSLIILFLTSMYSQLRILKIIKQKSFLFQVIFLMAILFVPKHEIYIRLLLLSLAGLSSGWAFRKSDLQNAVLLIVLGFTTFLFLSFLWLLFAEPIIWTALESFVQDSSIWLGRLTKQPLRLNVTASGVTISILYILLGISLTYFSKRPNIMHAAFFIGIILLINSLFVVFLHPLARWVQVVLNDIPVCPLNISFVLLALDGIALCWFIWDIDLRELQFDPIPRRSIIIISSLSALIICGVIYNSNIIKDSSKKGEILILDRGFFNWDKPEFGKYGLNSSGMFGAFPEYLKTMGYKTKMDSIITRKNIKGTTAIVIINLDKFISSEEKKLLREFVYNGGSILVMGDHTGLGGIMNPLNDLLDFVNIRYNFDCGHYLKKNWREAFFYPSHPIWEKADDELDLGISVGASLSISPLSAKPLLFAKYGYSDNGDSLNKMNAYLGDRTYNAGELLSDIILIAEGAYGKGKIIVFGDTSTFQNGALCYTFQTVNNIFKYLTASESSWNSSLLFRTLFLVIILISIASLLFAGEFFRPGTILGIVVITLIINILFSIGKTLKNPEIQYNRYLAYIDASHLNRFSQFGDDGIWSLSYHLMRNRYLPIVQRKFYPELLNSTSVAFFINQSSEINENEIQVVDNYVRKGGTAVWSFGYEEKNPVSDILKLYGVKLDNIPLGPIPPEQTSAYVQFSKAWPVLVENRTIKADTLCTGWDYPVIISKRVGEGRIVIVADPNFFLSENMEQNNSIKDANELFLRITCGKGNIDSSEINSSIVQNSLKLSKAE